ncbi:hypothetical protein F2Q70_00017515 [Brassica cretica]|uniref:Uncharacterized protein n=1 Tax=Brassica cretica TaxID=69181 RepID=A0A8S9HXG4_BRACR|nr:hypothetical protein F2Q70_00017515 [Brassica cretica]
MEFDSRRLGFPAAVFGFYPRRFFPFICFAVRSEYFFGLVVWCLFCPTRCNSDFAAACSAAEVVASSLPCSVRIGRSGFLEYRRLRRFEDLAFLIMDREAIGVSFGR